MSLTSMMNAAQIPPGMPGSLFTIPEAGGISDVGSFGSGLSVMKDLIPGFNDGGAFGQMTALSSDMVSHMAATVESLPIKAGIAQAITFQSNLVAQVDGLPVPGCSIFDSLFKATKNIGSMISNTLSSIGSAIGNSLSGLYSIVQGIVGGVIDSADKLLKAIGSAGGGILDSIKTAIGPLVSTMASTFTGFLSGIQSAVIGAVSQFANWVAEEAAAFTDALNKLRNFNFLGFLNVSDPCIAGTVHQLVNFANVDTLALNALKDVRKVFV